MQSLNKKERKLLELQITQTRHPKSVADRRTGGWSGPTTRPVLEIKETRNKVSIFYCKKKYDVKWASSRENLSSGFPRK